MASVIARLDDQQFGPTPSAAGVAVTGEVESSLVMGGPDRPIWLWAHRLQPGASLAWEHPGQDNLIYVWEGAVEARRLRLAPDEAFVVEHGARGEIRASEPALVLHFHRAEHLSEPQDRAGGHTHLLAGCAVRRGVDPRTSVGISLFADAACPTCEVWLHGNQLPPDLRVEPHYHSEDEIIVVTEGSMRLGRLEYGRGSVLAIDAETRYAFSGGGQGLAFINYRTAPPTYSIADHSHPAMDERAVLLNGLARSAAPARPN
jgi:hypothetical protein